MRLRRMDDIGTASILDLAAGREFSPSLREAQTAPSPQGGPFLFLKSGHGETPSDTEGYCKTRGTVLEWHHQKREKSGGCAARWAFFLERREQVWQKRGQDLRAALSSFHRSGCMNSP